MCLVKRVNDQSDKILIDSHYFMENMEIFNVGTTQYGIYIRSGVGRGGKWARAIQSHKWSLGYECIFLIG